MPQTVAGAMGSDRAAASDRSAAKMRASRSTAAEVQPAGRPRDPTLDIAILEAAEEQLRERGYSGMSMESVARAAGTTVPSLRRRYCDKATLAAAVVDSMRIARLTDGDRPPREQTLAILENFRRNLARTHSMALLGTLLVEEGRNPELLGRFRARLVKPRRAMLREALESGVRAGELAADMDIDAAVSMLIGSFYALYVSRGRVPKDWPERVLASVWRPPIPRP
jgi:AcrR family transcriptional regulator